MEKKSRVRDDPWINMIKGHVDWLQNYFSTTPGFDINGIITAEVHFIL